jgi:predicted tellurium resistance membrane protein TerC
MDCRPSIWAGLITLVVIELVLGIDNLVFIAILAEKLPPRSATARASPVCCWQW